MRPDARLLAMIRRATPDDAEAIAEAHRKSLGSGEETGYTVEVVDDWLEPLRAEEYLTALAGGTTFIVAPDPDSSGALLGFASHRAIEGAHRTAVYVRRRAQRQGLGTVLFGRAEARAYDAGARALNVSSSLEAVPFYAANGFNEVGRGDHMLASGRSMACVFMHKPLFGQPHLTATRNFRQADAGVFVAGQPSEVQLASAAKQGVRLVINLALHDDPRYSLPDERATVESLGMTYVHIPVQFKAPTRRDLEAFFNAMDDHPGEATLVHCAANYRVTAFLGLYRAIRLRMPLAEAFAPMHTVWEPDAVWSAFIQDTLTSSDL